MASLKAQLAKVQQDQNGYLAQFQSVQSMFSQQAQALTNASILYIYGWSNNDQSLLLSIDSVLIDQ